MKTFRTAPSIWPRVVITAGAAAALLLAACADDDIDPTSTPEPPTATATASVLPTGIATVEGGGTDPSEINGPPAVTASGSGVEGPLGVGTYCWTETAPGATGGAGICADAIGVITTPQIFSVPADTTFEVIGFGEFEPTSGTALVWPDSIPSQSVGAFAQAWIPEGDPQTLDVTVDGDSVSFVADLDAGRYVVALGLLFPEGDVQYGLVVEVQ